MYLHIYIFVYTYLYLYLSISAIYASVRLFFPRVILQYYFYETQKVWTFFLSFGNAREKQVTCLWLCRCHQTNKGEEKRAFNWDM